jgi:hypothetical protein
MRLALVVVLGLVGCDRGIKFDTRVIGRDALAKASTDAGAMTRLLRGSVVNGGLWFDDPACGTKFPAGEIADDLPGFARCLVGLKLVPSPRKDALGDVVVMTYAPGFEVEVRIVEDKDGPRLTWIGFESRREQDKLPTISGDALESLRLSGDRDGPIDAAAAGFGVEDTVVEMDKNRSVTSKPYTASWLKVCIDAEGTVTSADAFETTSYKAQVVFIAAAKTWKFRPFTVRDRPIAVCAMSRLAYPPRSAPAVETIPLPPPPSRGKQPIVFARGAGTKLLEGKRTFGNKAIAPDDETKTEIQRLGSPILEGSFRICLDATGAIESILPLRSTGIAAYDRKLLAGMRTWRYSAYKIDDQGVPVCTAVTFIYKQR